MTRTLSFGRLFKSLYSQILVQTNHKFLFFDIVPSKFDLESSSMNSSFPRFHGEGREGKETD